MGAERECRAAAGRDDRRLLAYLVASRPERAGGSALAAALGSLGLHGTVLGLAAWATALAVTAHAGPLPARAEPYRAIDLLPPSAILHASESSPASSAHRAKRATPAARPAGALAEQAALIRRLLDLTPPTVVPTEVPPAIQGALASLQEDEYAGLVKEGQYTAAEIVADHHDPTADDLDRAGPTFVTYTSAPELENTEQVRKVLNRSYPQFLQDEGVGGRVMLWFLIDEHGAVRRWLLKQSSGIKALDRAALKVAALMRFRPAVNYDRKVAVWVAMPVVFRVLESPG